MDGVKKIIDTYRDEFENEQIPIGHKERFFSKLNARKVKSQKSIRRKYLSIAATLLLLILPFVIFKNYSIVGHSGNIDYEILIAEQNDIILGMSENLDPVNRFIVTNALNQLVFEAIPFNDQIPEYITEEEKSELKKSYYCPKIKGLIRLKGYIENIESYN